MDKPTLPKGTRDFGPAQMAKRQFIFNTIRTVFQKYGFMPLETPAMENLSTLTGKYGEEGDQLLFRVLNSGPFFDEVKRLLNFSSKQDAKAYFEYLIPNIHLEYVEPISTPAFDEKVNDFLKKKLPDLGATKENLDFFKDFTSQRRARILGIFNSWIDKQSEVRNRVHENEKVIVELINELYDFIFDRALKIDSRSIVPSISEKGLRYDLTVPFARYVVMNRGEITLPFKRYQIQPVWRADRPQKGRYREFFQCDADVVGTDSLVNEAEIVLMIQEVFKGLGLTDYTIKINHRGVLSGLAEISGAQNEGALFVAIDKLDKIGEDGVKKEMNEKGISSTSAQQVFDILNFKGSNEQKLIMLKAKFANSEKGKKGIDDLENVFKILSGFNAGKPSTIDHRPSTIELDISLARGLSYYTGTIFEVKVNNVAIGSVSGGGRYDNLTQSFGAKEKLSGVGISFGIDRLYDVLEELKLFPASAGQTTKVLVTHFDEASMAYGLGVAQNIRNQGISCEIYPELSKLKKQLEYADKKQIPFAIVVGSDEVSTGVLTLKNLATGEQEKLKLNEIVTKLNQ